MCCSAHYISMMVATLHAIPHQIWCSCSGSLLSEMAREMSSIYEVSDLGLREHETSMSDISFAYMHVHPEITCAYPV